MTKTEALLFDIDGTLVHEDKGLSQALLDVLREIPGLKYLTDDVQLRWKGHSLEMILSEIEHDFHVILPRKEVKAGWTARVMEQRTACPSRAVPGALEAVQRLSRYYNLLRQQIIMGIWPGCF